MIYLLESGNYYKIGYAKNLEERLKAYNTHNPNYVVIDSMPGEKYDEKLLHFICKDYNEKLEWFLKNDKILETWGLYKKLLPEIEKLHITIKNKNSEIQDLKKKYTEEAEFNDKLQDARYNEMRFINNLYNLRTQRYTDEYALDYIDEFLKVKKKA